MKSKKEKEVAEAFESIMEKTGFFNHLVSDRGKEYVNKTFSKLMRDKGVNWYHPKSSSHACMAERVIRTIMGLLFKVINKNKSNNILPHFDSVINTYNNKYHSSIKMSPKNAESGEFDSYLAENIKKLRDKVKKQSPSLSLEDKVKVSLPQKAFYKGYRQKTSNEIFRIIKINRSHKIPMYTIENTVSREKLPGQFYSTELQKVKE